MAVVVHGHYTEIGLNYIIHTFSTMTQDLPKAADAKSYLTISDYAAIAAFFTA